MSFITDKQTLDDLNISARNKGNAIINLFDRTHTRGGAQLLEKMFQHPLSDANEINARSNVIRYFQAKALSFPVNRELCESVEHYLSMPPGKNRIGSAVMLSRKKLLGRIGADKEYEMICTGMLSTIEFIDLLNGFFDRNTLDDGISPYRQTAHEVKQILNNTGLQKKNFKKLSLWKAIQFDHLLRNVHQQSLRRLLQIVYEADVFISVSRVAAERKLSYAHAIPFEEGRNRIDITNVYHPQLAGAVANNFHADHDSNMIFLTGANMAGKSTFMKVFAIAIYMAHMGFPVAAEQMEFSVQDGLYSSINIADNLNRGYSHFYAEVLRVKHIAEELDSGKKLVIIFDELFKGTNVKDAYDATVAVTEAFAENRNAIFIVSTHIVEAGQTLQEKCPNIRFVYFPTIMHNGKPAYTYKLQEGISNDRYGMMILNNEGIIDILTQTA